MFKKKDNVEIYEEGYTQAEAKKKSNSSMILALLISLIAGAVVFIAMLNIEKKELSNYETIEVVRAVKDISKGTELNLSNYKEYLEIEEINKKDAIKDVYTSLNDVAELKDFFITTDMCAKEQLCKSKITAMSELVDESDVVQVSFSVTSPSDAVNGTLRRGNKIRVSSVVDTTETVILDSVIIIEAYEGTTLIQPNDTSKVATTFIVGIPASKVADFNSHTLKSNIKVSLLS